MACRAYACFTGTTCGGCACKPLTHINFRLGLRGRPTPRAHLQGADVAVDLRHIQLQAAEQVYVGRPGGRSRAGARSPRATT